MSLLATALSEASKAARDDFRTQKDGYRDHNTQLGYLNYEVGELRRELRAGLDAIMMKLAVIESKIAPNGVDHDHPKKVNDGS